MDYNVILEAAAKKHGSRVVKVLPDRQITLTYEEIEKLSLALAWWLRDMGLRKGDSFAVWMGNVPEYVLLMAASLRIGTVIVPISNYESSETVQSVCRECGCQLLVTDSHNKYIQTQLAQTDFPCRWVDIGIYPAETRLRLDFLGTAKSLPKIRQELAVTDDILIAYTSGSTGEKKGIRKSIASYFGKNGFSKFYSGAMELLRLVYPLRLYSLCPWYHNTGTYLLLISLSGGYFQEITTERYDPSLAARHLKEYAPNLWIGTATMLYRCCMCSDDPELRLPAVVLSTGEAMPDHIVKKLEEFPGVYFLHSGYGTTEAGSIACFIYRFQKIPLGMRVLMFFVKKAGFVKKVYDIGWLQNDSHSAFLGDINKNTEVLIVDTETHASLADGQVGEICVRTKTEMNGYLGEGASKVYLQYGDDLYLRTGDLGYKQGDVLYLSGRKKNMIIRSGENILPGDIERIALELPGVNSALACGIPSSAYGEDICLCLEADREKTDLEGLQNLLRNRLPKYMYPQYFLFWDVFPVNTSGKTDAQRVREEAIARCKLTL